MKPDFNELLALCPDIPEDFLTQYFAGLPDAYFDHFSRSDIRTHLLGLASLDIKNPIEIIVHSSSATLSGRITCTILAFDHQSAFALIAGVLSASGMDIKSGRIFTYRPVKTREIARRFSAAKRRHASFKRGRIIDTFSGIVDQSAGSLTFWASSLQDDLHRVFRFLEDGAWQRARDTVNDLVAARLQSQDYDLVAGGLLPVSLKIDNDQLHRTRLHILGQDTPFFLYSVSNALALRGYNIEQVRIETSGSQVADDLDLVDEHGRKLITDRQINELKLAVLLTKQFTYFLGNAPDPQAALVRFDRMVTDLLAASGAGEWEELLSNPRIMEKLARVLGTSDFLWEDFIRGQYESLLPIFGSGLHNRQFALSGRDLEATLHDLLTDTSSKAEAIDRLNAFKDRQVFLIDLEHILNPEYDFEKLSARLTELAELVVQQAFGLVFDILSSRYGPPRTVGDLPACYTCCGLGKLGGAALGYASDIELLTVYDDNGWTAGAEVIRNSEFFNRLVLEARQSIRTKRNGIFTVDLQLRPYGQDGPPASSLRTFCEYYGPGGGAHSYERLALVRLRHIAGDKELGRRLERIRGELIYRSDCLDLGELRELRKKQFLEKTPGGRINAKFSPGGLVDLEYDVQILQVMYGCVHSELKTPRIHAALAALSHVGIIASEESIRLTDAYRFLRRLINGLRMLRGSADDLFLPAPGDPEYLHLARRVGYRQSRGLSAAQQLQLDFDTYSATIRLFVETHFGRDSLPGKPIANVADIILSSSLPDQVRHRTLTECGFRDCHKALVNLRKLAHDGNFGMELARLAILMRDFFSRNPDPDMALNNWEKFTEALPDRRLHFELLLSQPKRLELLLSVFGTSQFLADTLALHPDFFEEVIKPELMNSSRAMSAMQDELRELSYGYKKYQPWLDALRHYRRREILRIAIRDICLHVPIEEVFSDLSNLAEAIIRVALERIWQELRNDGQFPAVAETAAERFCVMALGKLGGSELNYSSDIDLIAIYSPGSQSAQGKNGIDQVCFAQVFERLRAALADHTCAGRAYRVDLRLRAYGRAGALVQTAKSLTEYYKATARLWEIQALLKVRPVGGTDSVGHTWWRTIRPLLRQTWDPAEITNQIQSMRQKAMCAYRYKKDLARDIKNGAGGIRDLEFMVQGHQLLNAGRFPELLEGNTLRALHKLEGLQILPPEVVKAATESYRFLRTVEHHLQIFEDLQTHVLPATPAALTALARRILGNTATGELLEQRISDTRQTILSLPRIY